LEFGDVDLVEGGKLEINRRKTLVARREPTTNSTHMWHGTGIKPRPDWWEASAPTTAPTLLPKLRNKAYKRSYRKASRITLHALLIRLTSQ